MKRTTTTLMGAFAVAAVACGGAPLPVSELADSESAVAAAQEAGATRVPDAAAHLKLANTQIDAAKEMIDDGNNAEAKYTLDRAEADARLALYLARADSSREAAKKAQDRIDKLRSEQQQQQQQQTTY